MNFPVDEAQRIVSSKPSDSPLCIGYVAKNLLTDISVPISTVCLMRLSYNNAPHT